MKSPNRAPTMTDVARLAGVSQSTVSLVLNNSPAANIPDQTREKVLEASRQLGYRPNAIARALHGNGSGVIGFITDELVTTNFAGNIYKGAQDAAWKRHKMLMLINLNNRKGMLEEALEAMMSYQVESFIFATKYHHEFVLPDKQINVPVIFTNCFDPLNRYSSIVPNERAGAKHAVKHLIAKGHRKIAFLSNAKRIPATAGREEGYRDALAEHGIPYRRELLKRVQITSIEVFEAVKSLLSYADRPTALLCYNDRGAATAYFACQALGLRVPVDVSIMGFDNQTVITEYIVPGLTTMQLPHYEMGQEAVRFLFSGKELGEVSQTLLDLSLVERASIADITGL